MVFGMIMLDRHRQNIAVPLNGSVVHLITDMRLIPSLTGHSYCF